MKYVIEVAPARPRPGTDRPTPQQIASVLAALLPDGSQITVRVLPT